MSINGGIKFFTGAKNLYKDAATVTSASTNEAAAKYILNYNDYTLWESIGSNDITTETIEVTFNGAQTFDRLFIKKHNLKAFNVKYWSGTAYVDFSNVVGVNGVAKSGITETAESNTTSYYEFTEVTSDSIKITMDTTQSANAEKEITALLVASELGTFEGYPRVSKVKHDRNLRSSKALSGKYIIQKSYDVASFKISMKTYPLQDDIDLLTSLHDREDSFLVWLCGGRTGTSYFRLENRGYRLDDLYHMQVSRPIDTDYEKGIYTNGVNASISLVEVV